MAIAWTKLFDVDLGAMRHSISNRMFGSSDGMGISLVPITWSCDNRVNSQRNQFP